MPDYLIDLVSRLGQWSYLVIFLGATLESAAFLGVFVPGESLVLVAGFLSAQGMLDLDGVVFMAVIGAILGDNIGYELGRQLGRPWILHHGNRIGISAARLQRAQEVFSRHGGKAVFFGRFIGFARALVPFVAGFTRMPYRHFLCYNALGATLWSVGFILLGYVLGRGWRFAEHWMGRASVIFGGALLLVIVFGWVWRWLVRHEAGIKRSWARIDQGPRVKALRRRFYPQIVWLQERLTPGSYLGLQLTVGLVVLITATWMFGGIAEDVVTNDSLTQVDQAVAMWFHAHSNAPLTAFMSSVSRVHDVTGIGLLALLLAAYLGWKRLWHRLLALALTVPGGMLLNVLLKFAFHRARPALGNVDLNPTTYSFPSGHTMAATVLYGFAAALIVSMATTWQWKVLAVLVAITMIMLVGFSRVYLGVHYLSDVLAAIAEGVAWLALCLTAVRTMQRRS